MTLEPAAKRRRRGADKMKCSTCGGTLNSLAQIQLWVKKGEKEKESDGTYDGGRKPEVHCQGCIDKNGRKVADFDAVGEYDYANWGVREAFFGAAGTDRPVDSA